ncbi:MAG: hypothetical protein WC459_03075 [Patescibacteria group bacterium]
MGFLDKILGKSLTKKEAEKKADAQGNDIGFDEEMLGNNSYAETNEKGETMQGFFGVAENDEGETEDKSEEEKELSNQEKEIKN